MVLNLVDPSSSTQRDASSGIPAREGERESKPPEIPRAREDAFRRLEERVGAGDGEMEMDFVNSCLNLGFGSRVIVQERWKVMTWTG